MLRYDVTDVSEVVFDGKQPELWSEVNARITRYAAGMSGQGYIKPMDIPELRGKEDSDMAIPECQRCASLDLICLHRS